MRDKIINTRVVLYTLLIVVLMIFLNPSVGVPFNYLFEDNSTVLIYSIGSLIASVLFGCFIPFLEKDRYLAIQVIIISILSNILLYLSGKFLNDIDWLYIFLNPFFISGVGICILKRKFKLLFIIVLISSGFSTFHYSRIIAPFSLIPSFLIVLLILNDYRFIKSSRIGFVISVMSFHFQMGVLVIMYIINENIVFLNAENLIFTRILIFIHVLIWFYMLDKLINQYTKIATNFMGSIKYLSYIPILYLIPMMYILFGKSELKAEGSENHGKFKSFNN